MVLDFGGLFPNSALQQETGVLSDRWGQDGSSIINIYAVLNSGTEYTVTAGKKLYIETITLSCSSAGTLLIKDNATTLFRTAMATDSFNTVTFDTPLEFSTSIVSSNTGSFHGTFTGWEE